MYGYVERICGLLPGNRVWIFSLATKRSLTVISVCDGNLECCIICTWKEEIFLNERNAPCKLIYCFTDITHWYLFSFSKSQVKHLVLNVTYNNIFQTRWKKDTSTNWFKSIVMYQSFVLFRNSTLTSLWVCCEESWMAQ